MVWRLLLCMLYGLEKGLLAAGLQIGCNLVIFFIPLLQVPLLFLDAPALQKWENVGIYPRGHACQRMPPFAHMFSGLLGLQGSLPC